MNAGGGVAIRLSAARGVVGDIGAVACAVGRVGKATGGGRCVRDTEGTGRGNAGCGGVTGSIRAGNKRTSNASGAAARSSCAGQRQPDDGASRKARKPRWISSTAASVAMRVQRRRRRTNVT